MIQKTEFGFTGSVTDLPVWARENPELGVAGALVATQQVQVLSGMDNVTKALELFEKAREANPYLYFELAYTRQTDWMCWLIDKQGGGRVVLCEAQGMTPDEAAINVRLTLEALCKAT